jgi:hypothetical protein
VPEFCRCVLFEWGWPFLAVVLLAIMVVILGLIGLAKFFGLPKIAARTTKQAAKYKDAEIEGGVVPFLVFVAVLVAICGAVYYGHNKVSTAYSVSFDTASTPSTDLESLRSRYQGETHATIIVADDAKKFSVAGHYSGTCVVDLFEAICRQHPDRLVCESSVRDQKLVIGLKAGR